MSGEVTPKPHRFDDVRNTCNHWVCKEMINDQTSISSSTPFLAFRNIWNAHNIMVLCETENNRSSPIHYTTSNMCVSSRQTT